MKCETVEKYCMCLFDLAQEVSAIDMNADVSKQAQNFRNIAVTCAKDIYDPATDVVQLCPYNNVVCVQKKIVMPQKCITCQFRKDDIYELR